MSENMGKADISHGISVIHFSLLQNGNQLIEEVVP